MHTTRRSVLKPVAFLVGILSTLALGERAGATGMIAQRLAHPDIQRFSGFTVAEHRGDVLFGASCSGPAVEDLVYLFDADTGAAELVIPNPSGIPCEGFGQAVASDGDEIFVGSPVAAVGVPPRGRGAVFVFSGTTGALSRVLPAPDAVGTGGRFGSALLVAGPDLFVVAARADAPLGGRGVVFRIDAQTGAVLATYANPNGPGLGEFGASLAIAGDRLLVGDPEVSSLGLVEVFDVTTGAHLVTLHGQDATAFRMGFGRSLAVAGGRVAVGAPAGPGGIFSQDHAGAVYFYDEGSLELLEVVGAPEVSTFGNADFGHRLAVFDGDFLVTAPNAPVGDNASSGAAYLLDGTTGEILYRFHAPRIGASVARVGSRVALSAGFIDAEGTVGYLFETCASLGDGAACDDGNGCDVGDVCQGLRCSPGAPVVCGDEVARCRLPGCEPATGICNQRLAAAGTSCFTAQEVCSRPDVCDGSGGCAIDPDPDPDRDRVCSFDDTCPIIADPGQEDADADTRGDVCDPSDALLVVHDASVRASRQGRPNGKLKVRGEFLSRVDSPFDPEEGLIVRVEDRASELTWVFVWPEDECSGTAPSRAGCRHGDRPASRIDFRPLAHQVGGFVVYRFALAASDLEIEDLPVGPLVVTITSQPPRSVSGFDRAGVVTGCRPLRTRLHCRVSAGAP